MTGSGTSGATPPPRAEPYDRSFFDEETTAGSASARQIVSLLVELLAPRSVIDVGCGTGAFLREFRDRGVTDYLGIEGPWVAGVDLLVDRAHVTLADLTRPVEVGRRFDLAICLEVAEHLEAPFADGLIELLTRVAPAVAFSAALPLQGGTHHVNLRWPPYWARKFRDRGYVPVDCLRRRLAERPGVFQFYVQNALLYVQEAALQSAPRLAALAAERVHHVPVYLYSPGNPKMSRFLNRAPSPLREALYVVLRRRGIV